MPTLHFRRPLALASTLLALAAVAQAHQLWVGASNYLLTYPGARPGPVSTVAYVSFGHRFPIDEPIDDARFGGVYLHAPGAAARRLPSSSDGYRAAPLAFEKAGAYWVSSVNRPIFSTQLKDAQGVMSYVRVPKNEAPAGANVVDATQIFGFAKALISVQGAGADTTALSQPLGHTLELVPEKNPATAAVGEKIPFRVYFNGRPYAGEPIEVVAESVAAPQKVPGAKWSGETDRSGRVNVPAALPGVWVLIVTVIEPTTGDLKPKANQIRYRATLTFEVPGGAYGS